MRLTRGVVGECGHKEHVGFVRILCAHPADVTQEVLDEAQVGLVDGEHVHAASEGGTEGRREESKRAAKWVRKWVRIRRGDEGMGITAKGIR